MEEPDDNPSIVLPMKENTFVPIPERSPVVLASEARHPRSSRGLEDFFRFSMTVCW